MRVLYCTRTRYIENGDIPLDTDSRLVKQNHLKGTSLQNRYKSRYKGVTEGLPLRQE